MTYIVMNNGCYGLTKGQFSATNDKNSPSKKGEANPFDAIDLCQMAIQLGAGFVARSFSGDKTPADPADQGGHQLQRLRLPRRHQPVRDVQQPLRVDQELRLRARAQHGVREQARLRRAEGRDHRRLRAAGTTAAVTLHDGSRLMLNKLDGGHDFRDPDDAIMTIRRNATKGRWRPACSTSTRPGNDLHDVLDTDDRPLNALPMMELCPGAKALERSTRGSGKARLRQSMQLTASWETAAPFPFRAGSGGGMSRLRHSPGRRPQVRVYPAPSFRVSTGASAGST